MHHEISTARPLSHPHRRPGILTALAVALLTMVPGPGDDARAATIFSDDRSQAELYGILDLGVGYLEHSYAASDVLASTVNSFNLNASPHSFTGVYSGGLSMSRVGVRGETRFGAAARAFFRLESAVDVNTGVLSNNGQAIYNNTTALRTANSASAINGQWFSRAAYLGFANGAWGAVSLGRNTNFALEQTAEYDPLQAALLFSPIGYSGGIGGGLGATENSRLDRSVKYDNRIDHVSFGGEYKFAGDNGSHAAGSAWVAMLGYDNVPLRFKGTYSQTTNSVTWPVQYSNVTPPSANVQVEDTKGYMLAGAYTRGRATVRAGYENLTVYAPSNPNLNVQDYYGLLLPKHSVNATGQQYYNLFWVGGDYRFSPAFDLSAALYDIDTYDSPEIGRAYWATAYSLIADYNFTAKFDSYIGVMLMEYSGAGLSKRAPIIAFSSNGMYGFGVRFKF